MAAAGRPFWRWLASAVAGLILALLPATGAPVGAHPLGNFTVNRYSRVEIGLDGFRVRYVLDLAEIPSVQETQLADVNHDGVVSPAEWDTYRDHRVDELRSNLALAVDGQSVQFRTDQSALSNPMGQGNIPLIRIEAWFRAPMPRLIDGTSTLHSATFQDRNEPARLGWREIVVQAEAGVALSQSSVPAADSTDELRAYPERFLQDPLDVREANWTFLTAPVNSSATPGDSSARPNSSATAAASSGTAGSSAAPDSRASGATAGRAVDPFTSLVAAADLNVGVVILALAGAATLGGIHAASPGHGKTVMAAYIVGTRGTFVHAVVLGLSVTVSHTFGVLVLGVITLLASNLILPERLYPWLTLIAALVILAFGSVLLIGSLRGLRQQPPALVHPHSQAHDHDHHSHLGRAADGHAHEHRQSLPLTWKNLFVLGLAGGLVPSASALVVLLSALALGRLGFGLLLIIAFGVGMAVVLTATGVLLVYASRFVARYFPEHAQSPLQRALARSVPVASAAVMLLIGVIATLQALGQFGILPI